MADHHDAKKLRAELDAIKRLMEDIPIGVLKAIVHTQAAQQAQSDELVAAFHGGPRPLLTPGAQAVLFRDTQEKNK